MQSSLLKEKHNLSRARQESPRKSSRRISSRFIARPVSHPAFICILSQRRRPAPISFCVQTSSTKHSTSDVISGSSFIRGLECQNMHYLFKKHDIFRLISHVGDSILKKWFSWRLLNGNRSRCNERDVSVKFCWNHGNTAKSSASWKRS